ncbi:hypothetical protein SLA2020_208060 [Shorea laevis]
MLSTGVGRMATATVTVRSISMALIAPQRTGCVWTPLAFSSSSASPSKSRKLVLYSKPGCCLCDGLKEKLQAAFSLSGPDSLHDVDLQLRDITTNPEWETAYQYEIPVLAKILADGTEVSVFALSFYSGIVYRILQIRALPVLVFFTFQLNIRIQRL